ncbi:leucyl/phenylalanyl-tRNA--protein transferase [Aurantivibrio infirmus]
MDKIPWLAPDNLEFPPIEQAWTEPNGLLAVGGDLSPQRLIKAYQSGIFPWYEAGQPILWWSPDPRIVLRPEEVHISKSLEKTLRKKRYRITADTAFRQVMRHCAEPRAGQRGTWITDDMISAYSQLHELGHAHSIEAWENGSLCGGLYGVALGKLFFGESMFTKQTDASKVAFATLASKLASWGFQLIDCQVETAHLNSLGARQMSREDFSKIVRNYGVTALGDKRVGSWRDIWLQDL